MSTLRERNTAALKKAVNSNETVKTLREAIKRRHSFDMFDEKAFPVMNESFSWKAARQKLELKEADASGAFVQLLRAGVQTLVNSMYMSVPTTFEDWAKVVNSSLDTELYAPLHGIGFPSEVPAQGVYPETGAAGLDIKLGNRKYGEIFAVSEELLMDDQTGQMQQQVKLIAEYLKQVLEVLAYGKLASVSGAQYGNMTVPTSETKPSYESTYPWSTALRGSGATRPGSFGTPTQANIQSAIIALINQRNLLGLKMGVVPSRLVIGPKYEFDASILLHSAYYPSGAAAAGSTGGAFAINPIKGILDKTMSRFMFDNTGAVSGTSSAWYVMDDKQPWFVVQVREAASVIQEASNAGDSFNRDVIRFKGRMRANADHIDPRFAYQGSDGSV